MVNWKLLRGKFQEFLTQFFLVFVAFCISTVLVKNDKIYGYTASQGIRQSVRCIHWLYSVPTFSVQYMLDMTFTGSPLPTIFAYIVFTRKAIHMQKQQRGSFTSLLNLLRFLAYRYQIAGFTYIQLTRGGDPSLWWTMIAGLCPSLKSIDVFGLS